MRLYELYLDGVPDGVPVLIAEGEEPEFIHNGG